MEREKIEGSCLSEADRGVLAVYVDSVLPKGGGVAAPSLEAQWFQLFLEGYTASEIQRLNPQYPLGMVLHAQVKYGWDARKDDYAVQLQQRVMEKLMRTQLEAVNFVSDLIAASHKRYGEKVKRYIQTGDEKLLDGVEIASLGSYRGAIETLHKLTGQDKERAAKPGAPAGSVIDGQATVVGRVSPGTARTIIRRALAAGGRK